MRDGAWGEFFPASLSPFGYNETVAQEYFPMKREEVLGNSPLEGLGVEVLGSEIPLTPFLKGEIFNWSDYEAPFPKVEKVIPASKLPDHITKIPDDILNWVIECEVSGKPFRIIKQELEFYRKHNLPIPRRHPDVRHMDRMKLRNPRKLFERVCDCESCEENNRKVQSAQKSGHIEEVPFLTNPRTGKTGRKMITTYSPARLERVYCEECYN